MSDEYQIILKNKKKEVLINDIAKQISLRGLFEIIDMNSNYISCVYIQEAHNDSLKKWGGNFILAKDNETWFLTINIGNISEIRNEIVLYFNELNIEIIIKDLE